LTRETRRVLLADDDPTIMLLLEHVLEALGRPYDTADDGEQAWAAWEKQRHALAVLDIEMPGLDGLELTRRIRKADPERNTFVLVVTGRDKAADLEAVLEAGADDYVTKPTTGQRLLARMRIAERRMAIDEELRRARWLAGIGEATVGLKHEINNPLTGLLGTAELLMLDLKEKGYPLDDITVIMDEARRIAELVKKLDDLRDAQSVPYTEGVRMLDLGTSQPKR
jgi:DNA-binding response OmpR family regulator